MKFQAATVIAGAAMAAGANAQQATQWRVQDGGNGHWYAVSIAGFPRTWNDCRVTALHEGGHLATLTSAGEHAFVLARAQATAGAWSGGFGPVLGGYQPVPNGGPAADWTWLTGEPWAFETWINGEPNDHAECGPGGDERFLAFLADGWNDIQDVEKCSFGWLVPSFVIEWSADCNGDGIVDYGQCRDGSLPDYDGDNVPDCCEQGVACVVGAYPVEWRASEGGNGHWYAAHLTWREWDDARAIADALGGHLATVTSAAENEFVADRTSLQYQDYWLGAKRTGSNCSPPCLEWITGEPWEYEVWAGSDSSGCRAPNPNACGWNGPGSGTVLEIYGRPDIDGHRKWNDEAPDLYFFGPIIGNPSIIEWSADCDSDGIVDYGQILRGERPDANANGVPDGCECFADLNTDGYVQGADLGLMLSSWGAAPAGTAADVNRDGAVDGNDLGLLLAAWGPCGN